MMRNLRRQAGMSLIEVLTALLIFSLGILGLMSLQIRAIQFSSSAEDTNRAALLANEIATEMWTRSTVNLPTGVITAWQQRVAGLDAGGNPEPTAGLPGGEGLVEVTAGVANIEVTWQPTGAASAPTNRNRFVTQVLIPAVGP
jgi:type IV pilus assembly protein PilV